MKFISIQLDGGQKCIVTQTEALTMLENELDSLEPGYGVLEIKAVDMTKEAVANLKEFEGW